MRVKAIMASVLALTGLSGCATSQFSGFSSAPLAQVALVQHPDVNLGRFPEGAVEKISRLSKSCQEQISKQTAGMLQSVLSGAVPSAAAGFAGVGTGANLGINAPFVKYAQYGAVAGAAGGAVAGATMGSASRAAAIGGCTQLFWEVSKKGGTDDPRWGGNSYAGTFAVPVLGGKKLFGADPPK